MRARLRVLWQHLKRENASPAKLAVSAFTGIFLGVVPLYGIQTGLCLLVAWMFRLNRLVVLSCAQISLPMFAPFLIAGGIVIGELVRFGRIQSFDLQLAHDFIGSLSLFSGQVPDLFVSCFVGDVILGFVLGMIAAGVAYRVASGREEPVPE